METPKSKTQKSAEKRAVKRILQRSFSNRSLNVTEALEDARNRLAASGLPVLAPSTLHKIYYGEVRRFGEPQRSKGRRMRPKQTPPISQPPLQQQKLPSSKPFQEIPQRSPVHEKMSNASQQNRSPQQQNTQGRETDPKIERAIKQFSREAYRRNIPRQQALTHLQKQLEQLGISRSREELNTIYEEVNFGV